MEMERNNEARVRADFIQVILGERAYGLILARIFNRAAVNCREQAFTLKFRLLSIHFTSEPFEKVRTMSAMGILRQLTTPLWRLTELHLQIGFYSYRLVAFPRRFKF